MIGRELSEKIFQNLEKVSSVFSDFQNKSKLHCPPGCGQCCFKPYVSCSPYELLPLALSLLDSGRAESALESAYANKDKHCLLLNVTNAETGQGYCGEYQYRPFVCRAFGVSARHGKHGVDYSICRVLKDSDTFSPDFGPNVEDIPFIEIWKKNLEALDPYLSDKEIPINQALIVILEKVLLWDSYQKKEV